MKKLIFAFLVSISAAFSLQAAIEVHEFDSPEQEQLFRELGKEIRCPKCQNNNIADSNAGLAQDLRAKVYEMLKEGKSKEEIVDYMKARYGNFVTYDPPLTPSTLILWLAPLAFILVGFAALFRLSKNKANQDTALSAEEKARLAALLKEEQTQNEDDKK